MTTKTKSMSKAEKRVAIAKDVILQLNAKNYKSLPGWYVKFNKKFTDQALKKDLSQNDELQVQAIFKELNPKCEVCARGAMFCSAVRKFNDLKCGQLESLDQGILDSYDIEVYEEKFFTKSQIGLIESYFEGKDMSEFSDLSDSHYDQLKLFNRKNKNPQKRMVLIMKNIIKNKGTFVPSQLT